MEIVAEGMSPPPNRSPATTPEEAPELLPTAEVTEAGDDFSLAEPGATIDPSPTPPAVEIDTGGLEALPPNTGSLEDCRADKPPRPIPDISHMKLVDD